MSRARVALAAVIVTALMPAAGILRDALSTPAMFRWRDDPISAFERHIAPLRAAVHGQRAVGYLAPEGVDRTAHLYTTRYALAPVQVFDSLDLPLVVADGVTDPRHLPSRLRVRRDFGDGLLLLEPAQP